MKTIERFLVENDIVLEIWHSDGQFHCLATKGTDTLGPTGRAGRLDRAVEIAIGDLVGEAPALPIETARDRVVVFGPVELMKKRPIDLDAAREMVANGRSVGQAAQELGVTRARLYHALRRKEKGDAKNDAGDGGGNGGLASGLLGQPGAGPVEPVVPSGPPVALGGVEPPADSAGDQVA